MVELIIFDLDGVLIDAKNIHYRALNDAIKLFSPNHIISWTEHLIEFDGLKTNQKLKILSEKKGLDVKLHESIWLEKQKITMAHLSDISPSQVLSDLMKKLSTDGYKIACCSNSIRKTVLTVLSKLQIIEYFDYILSNEDVLNCKPHPEIYWSCISKMCCMPENTLIIEDSPYGLLAASKTKANMLRVSNPDEVNIKNIYEKISMIENQKKDQGPKWVDKKLNVLIPMAGAGSRFEKAGFTFPKPLIDVKGEPMIKLVADNINIDANFIYVVQNEHRQKYNLDTLLNMITPKCKIVEVNNLTDGAACTTLLAKEFINNNNPLIIANSDQFIKWDSNEFMYKMLETDCDAGILTFNSSHPKWSFVKVNENGFVTEVAEKKPISNVATVGIYYWKKGADYIKYAEQMIDKNIRINNEFYVCPVFNQAISDGKKIRTFEVEEMWGLGTPEDLHLFLSK